MLQRVWTITSDSQLQTLHVNIPGAVFVDYDESIGSSGTLVSLQSASDEEIPVAECKIVAQIIVTSDSTEILECLECLELAPKNGHKGDQGVNFTIKNKDVKLKGSMLTQVLLSEKSTLRDFSTRSAETVVGESVLVHDDSEAHVSIEVRDAGILHISSTQGFTLQELSVAAQTAGIAQVQVPFIKAQDHLILLAGAKHSATMVSAATISSSEIHTGVVVLGDVEVQTSNLTAETMTSIIGLCGSVRVLGDGKVALQAGNVFGLGKILTGGIVSDKGGMSFGFAGQAMINAELLHVSSPFFGTVEYTNAVEPELVKPIVNWLWRSRTDILRPVAADWATKAFTPYKFIDAPLRQPMAVNHRVKISQRLEPELQRAGEFSWTTIGLTTGAVAVGAIAVIAMRRRASRLAKVL